MRTVLPPLLRLLPSPRDSLTNGLLLWETCCYTVNKSDVNAFTKSPQMHVVQVFFGDKGITMATEAGWAVRRQAPPHKKKKKISHTLPQTHKTLPHKQRLLNYFTTLLWPQSRPCAANDSAFCIQSKNRSSGTRAPGYVFVCVWWILHVHTDRCLCVCVLCILLCFCVCLGGTALFSQLHLQLRHHILVFQLPIQGL